MPSTCLFVHCRLRLGTLRAWTIDRSSLGLVAQGCSKGAEQKKCMRNLLAVRYMAQRVAGIIKTETKEQRRDCVRTLATTRAFSRQREKLSCRRHCSIISTESNFFQSFSTTRRWCLPFACPGARTCPAHHQSGLSIGRSHQANHKLIHRCCR